MDTRYPRHKKLHHPKADARHRKKYKKHKHNPCPHKPRQLDFTTDLQGVFFKHLGRKRHNHWAMRVHWSEVNTDSDGFPMIILRYEVEIDESADGIDWFLSSRHMLSAKDDFDTNHADHLRVFHIHGRLAYRYRVRAISANCKAVWSGYYVLGTPDDTPPAPHDVEIHRASHGIRLRWHADVDVEDDEIFNQDIAYFVAELWNNPDFGPSLDFTALASNDTFTTSAHGMSDGDTVMLQGTVGGPTLPNGVRPWRMYHVDVQSSTTFKLVFAESGTPVNLTTNGDGVVHIGLVRKARHVHKHHHRFRIDPDDYDEDVKFYGRVRSHSDHRSKSAWIPATAPDGNDDPDATPTGRRPLWHRHGGMTFTIPGRVQQKLYAVPHRMEDDYIIRRVTAAANIAGSGGPTRFDIKVNAGTHVFDLITGNEVTLAGGDHDASSKQVVNAVLSRGDHIRVHCTDVGSSPPRDVTVHVVADRLAPRELSAVDSGGGGGQTLILLAARGRSQTTSNLYNIDPALASETSIGAIGFAMTALVQDPTTGVVYGATSNNSASDPKSLVMIDPLTGGGTLVAAFSAGEPMTGFAISSTGIAYGVQAASGTGFLRVIDLSDGTETDLGAGPGVAAGLAFDDNDVLWAVFNGDAGTVDTTTGTYTTIYNPSFTGDVQGVAFVDGLLWILAKDGTTGGELYTLDITDGSTIDIGAFATTNLDALAWVFA
jgi:hypothetical protein